MSDDNHIRSLFIVALPRSLSTIAYHAARTALGFAEPVWTTDGEILNNDRFCLYGRPAPDIGVKYVRLALEPETFRAVMAFLGDVTRRESRVYKDVVQPFALSAWLPASGLRVLRLRRPVEDVAFAMRLKNWTYPARAASAGCDGRSWPEAEVAVIDGLLRAEQALETVPGEVVDYDCLIEDEGALSAALVRLYGANRVREIRYIDDEFCRMRDTVLARREGASYTSLESLVHERRIMLGIPPHTDRALQVEAGFNAG